MLTSGSLSRHIDQALTITDDFEPSSGVQQSHVVWSSVAQSNGLQSHGLQQSTTVQETHAMPLMPSDPLALDQMKQKVPAKITSAPTESIDSQPTSAAQHHHGQQTDRTNGIRQPRDRTDSSSALACSYIKLPNDDGHHATHSIELIPIQLY